MPQLEEKRQPAIGGLLGGILNLARSIGESDLDNPKLSMDEATGKLNVQPGKVKSKFRDRAFGLGNAGRQVRNSNAIANELKAQLEHQDFRDEDEQAHTLERDNIASSLAKSLEELMQSGETERTGIQTKSSESIADKQASAATTMAQMDIDAATERHKLTLKGDIDVEGLKGVKEAEARMAQVIPGWDGFTPDEKKQATAAVHKNFIAARNVEGTQLNTEQQIELAINSIVQKDPNAVASDAVAGRRAGSRIVSPGPNLVAATGGGEFIENAPVDAPAPGQMGGPQRPGVSPVRVPPVIDKGRAAQIIGNPQASTTSESRMAPRRSIADLQAELDAKIAESQELFNAQGETATTTRRDRGTNSPRFTIPERKAIGGLDPVELSEITKMLLQNTGAFQSIQP